ncbi:MAG TPA: PH domain-containing protein [bacterium]
MGYVDRNLLPGETVEYRAHLHPVIFLQSAVFGVIGLGFVVYGLASPGLAVFWVLGAIFLIYAASFGIGRAILYLSSEFAITNKRVVIKVGLIHRHTLEMLLTKVETIRVDQGLLARLIGYGTIVLTGTGGTNEPFTSIANPLEFRKQVQARAAGQG